MERAGSQMISKLENCDRVADIPRQGFSHYNTGPFSDPDFQYPFSNLAL
jgi:hypothetical protein